MSFGDGYTTRGTPSYSLLYVRQPRSVPTVGFVVLQFFAVRERIRCLRRSSLLHGNRDHTCHHQRHIFPRRCAWVRSSPCTGLLLPGVLPSVPQSGCAADAQATVFCLAKSRLEARRDLSACRRVTRLRPMQRVNVPESRAPRRSPGVREIPDQESPPQVNPSTSPGKQGGGMRSHLRTILAAVCAVSLLPAVAAAQGAATISGRVLNESGSPLPNASVFIPGGMGALTKDDGRYTFTVPASRMNGETVTITARLIGFKASEQQITLKGGAITQDFVLASNPVVLQGIVVTALGQEKEKSQL